jgi:hypothetical protein
MTAAATGNAVTLTATDGTNTYSGSWTLPDPALYPSGLAGVWSCGWGGPRVVFDNVVVTGPAQLSVSADAVQVLIPPSLTGVPTLHEGDHVAVAGIAGKGIATYGKLRAVIIREPTEVQTITP